MNKQFTSNVNINDLTFQIMGVIDDQNIAVIDIICPNGLEIIDLNLLGYIYRVIEDQQRIRRCKLNSIILNKGLRKIVHNTFRYAIIKCIDIPALVKTVEANTFKNCRYLTNVTLNEGTQTISRGAFFNTKVETIVMPSTMVTIGDNAFNKCTNLTKVTLNEGLKEIGWLAFANTAIESIVIPKSIKEIGFRAFANCQYLTKIKLNEGLKIIREFAFAGAAVKSIVIPASVEVIGIGAFEDCNDLKQVVIHPNSLVSEYSKDDLIKIFGDKVEIIIGNPFILDEKGFKSNRRVVNAELANTLGTKLINLVSHPNFSKDDLSLVYDLLLEGANPDIQDKDGNTGLMHMIDKQIEDGISMYLASGCNINILNNFGHTALIKALRLNMDKLVAILLDKVTCYQRDLSDIKAKVRKLK